MSAGVPSHVSESAIPDFVYNLPPNMQAQPALVRYICQNCLVTLSTVLAAAPDGTLSGFVQVFARPGYCKRKGNYGVCNGCCAIHVGCCGEPLAKFCRAVNVLIYLVDNACALLNRVVAREGAEQDLDGVLAAHGKVQRAWKHAFDYAGALRVAFNDVKAADACNVKNSNMPALEFAKMRVLSRELNMSRYEAGIGGIGHMQATNIIVDADAEAVFRRKGAARPSEKHFYYFGSNIPNGTVAIAPFMKGTSSPVKPSGFTDVLSTPRRPRPAGAPGMRRGASPSDESGLGEFETDTKGGLGLSPFSLGGKYENKG
ncbi:hypothetical protein EJ02DRAFT_426193 [Clathrospora elynae]|uniref:Uncharacterized protein n=1 Tax=Clathrospora elynae TaxID=706981 RepID=A0A6A5SD18_9PLEO|nr:hypothetical protein EJ02DRAFT_426193 [Clathrospora elynae]